MKRDWTLKQLEYWAARIEETARMFGLDPFPVVFDLVSDATLIEDVALLGMPLQRPHWSFGKAAQLAEYRKQFTGFSAVEIVPNSNPNVAKLRVGNSWPMHLLTIAHVFAHSDFMRHNRHFKNTAPESAFERMARSHRRVAELQADQNIGFRAVEALQDAAHAIRFVRPFPSSKDNPSLLWVIAHEANFLEPWERELLLLIDEETEYFVPQVLTKILNEGWASYWHEKILSNLPGLDDYTRREIRIESTLTVRRYPDVANGEWLNPYYVGIKLFEDIESRWNAFAQGKRKATEYWDGRTGREKIFRVRLLDSDASALYAYLTQPLAEDLGLFDYGPAQAGMSGSPIVVREIGDEVGWEAVRAMLVGTAGLGRGPSIRVASTNHKEQGKLYLVHEWDGRDLDEKNTKDTMEYLYRLWRSPVILETKSRRSRTPFWYYCDEHDVSSGRGRMRMKGVL